VGGSHAVEALDVVDAWGFKLKTMKGFTWHKQTRHGKSHFGMGNWTRANTEDCLFATKGHPVRASAGVRQFIDAPVRLHSQKPDEAKRNISEENVHLINYRLKIFYHPEMWNSLQ